MDVADFGVLYDYNAWANRRMLESCAALTPEQFLQDMKSSFASVRDTLAHIFGAQFVWLERWNQRVPQALPTPADFPDYESIRGRLTEMDQQLIAYVSGLNNDALDRILHFKL